MKTPATDVELWDYLQRLFGVGDWDEDDPRPFWKYRGLEGHKLGLLRRKRGASVAELVVTADYCKAHRIDVRNASWLYRHIADAKRWNNARSQVEVNRDLDEAIAAAIAHEAQDPNSEWFGRLVRVTGEHREEVYRSWLARS